MKKKGSHVGVMISFAIFITFVVFIFTVFDPIVNPKNDNNAVLEQLAESLISRFDGTLANIQSTAGKYSSDYDNLKNELGVPSGIEFGFRFVDEEEDVAEIVAEKEIPEGVNVYSKKTVVLYENNKKAGFLTVKIW